MSPRMFTCISFFCYKGLIKTNYTTNVGSSSSIANLLANGVDQEGDLSLVKCLSNYDVVRSSVTFFYVFCNNSILICVCLLLCSSLIIFLMLISVP